MANSLKDAIAGVSAMQSANYATDAAQLANPNIERYVYFTADTDVLIPLVRVQTPITINAAYFLPASSVSESDTNSLAVRLWKGNAAGGAGTAISSEWTTVATGQVGDLTAGQADGDPTATAKQFTITTAASANNIAAGVVIYLAVDESGTGPLFAGLISLEWTYQG